MLRRVRSNSGVRRLRRAAGMTPRVASGNAGVHASHQEHRRVLYRRHRPAAGRGDVAADRRQQNRRARSARRHQGRRRARRRRQRRHAGSGRRPRPSGVRRMDADPGHHRLDRQLRARRHDHDDLGLRAARAGPRLREPHARPRHLARGRDRRHHRPHPLERRPGACRHRHPRARHDGGALRPARGGEIDLRQVHLLSAGRQQGRGAALYSNGAAPAASAPRCTPAACRAPACRRCAATISCRGSSPTSPPTSAAGRSR